ncbi:hypothetical protein BH10PLA1_BH10PLA1_18320 [soil metagenome]
MPDSELQQLQDAVARNTAAVLSLPSAGMLRHQKSRFLAPDPEGFWMECSAEDHLLINELIATKVPAGISFKTAQVKTVFASPILERVEAFRINAETTVNSVKVKTPTTIKQIQRRLSYRVRVPAEAEMRLEVWRLSPRVPLRDRPSATQRVKVELVDLSVGGMGVVFLGENGDPPRICEEDRLRILINAGEHEVLVEGSMRFPRPGTDPTKLRTGVVFKAMDSDLEGRHNLAKLTKIVGELQRMEARRARLGVA